MNQSIVYSNAYYSDAPYERAKERPQSLGILGGSFNPVHWGHIYLAKLAMDRFALTRVLLLPSGDPPHKPEKGMLSACHRLAMVRLAAEELPGLTVSDMEVRRRGKTYSVDTLEILKAALPQTELYYIIGTDAFLGFWEWRNVPRVVELCTLLVFMRPGCDMQAVFDMAQDLREKVGAKVHLFNDMGIDVSASMVRSHIKKGKPIERLVPPSVAAYIQRHGLYMEQEE